MHIGLIGGIGVAATVAYYQKLTAEMALRNQPLRLTIEHADAQTLVANNAKDARDAQARVYKVHLDVLKAAGCDCAAITSLGGHFCYAETEVLSPLPLVSAVAPLDAYFSQNRQTCVGLLGTRVVMRTKLYGQLHRTKAVILDDDVDHLGQTYIDLALAGRATQAQRDLFLDAGRRLVDKGADAVVLAGTDLNLVFDGAQVDYPVIDALDVHVAELVAIASGTS